MNAIRVIPHTLPAIDLMTREAVYVTMPDLTVEIAPEVWRVALGMAYGGRVGVQVLERKDSQHVE